MFPAFAIFAQWLSDAMTLHLETWLLYEQSQTFNDEREFWVYVLNHRKLRKKYLELEAAAN